MLTRTVVTLRRRNGSKGPILDVYDDDEVFFFNFTAHYSEINIKLQCRRKNEGRVRFFDCF
jgi:hypothetical protein